MSSDSAPRRILFVCLGNICRSPAAEGVFARLATAAGLDKRGVSWDSCGVSGWHAGDLPDSRMIAAAAARGIHLTHRARKLRPEDFQEFDLILTMDAANYGDVCAHAPNEAAKAKVRPIVDWLRSMEAPFVPDPYYENAEAFEYVLDLLEDACAALTEEIAAKLPPDA